MGREYAIGKCRIQGRHCSGGIRNVPRPFVWMESTNENGSRPLAGWEPLKAYASVLEHFTQQIGVKLAWRGDMVRFTVHVEPSTVLEARVTALDGDDACGEAVLVRVDTVVDDLLNGVPGTDACGTHVVALSAEWIAVWNRLEECNFAPSSQYGVTSELVGGRG